MKNTMKKILCLFLVGSMVALAGCSGGGKSTEAVNPSEAKDLLDTIKERGYINVGTEGTYAPNTYHDESGKLVGFDVEVK